MRTIRDTRFRHALAILAFLTAASVAPHLAQAASSAPGAPTIGKATGGSAQASLLFTAPSSTGGAAITAYTASCITGTTTKTTVYGSGSSSPLVVKELTNGSVYVCSVKAVNSVGSSRASAGVVVTPAAVPGAPTIGVASAASARATVSFQAPSSTGGMVIKGYTASCVTGTATALTASGTKSPIVVTGLSNGSTYLCSVAAKNAMGTGASSGTVSVKPVGAVSKPGTSVVTGLTAGTGQISVAFTAGSGGTASSYTATCSSTSASKTTTGSSSPLVVTGLTAGANYSCTVKAINASGTSAVSNTVSTSTTAVSTAVSYSTPANFAAVVAQSYTPTTALTATSTVTNRGYYMISDAATANTASNYTSIGATYNATTGYTIASGTLASTSTYNDYLTKTMQLVTAADGNYRIDSYLHPNNSIDWGGSVSSPTLKFVNNFGKTSTTGNGFVTFAVTINATSKVATLQAKNRYTYLATAGTAANGSTPYTGTYTQDSSFAGSGMYVKLTGSAYSLNATGTSLYLYATPLSLGMPSFMNPNSIAFVTNGAAPFLTKVTTSAIEGTSGSIYKQVNSTYTSQVATAGTNTATKTAATAMLAAITASMKTCGESLRYSTEVYSAYRDAALATKLVSDSIADGAPGQNLVPYVYFTNEQDTSGKCHPFMVVVSYGNQASPNGLKDVPHPPGSAGASYPDATVTRYSNLENYTFSIPMKDYGLVTDVTTNVYPSSATRNLWYDTTSPWVGQNEYTWADSADNGILIDGSVIFPTFNNALVPSHLAGELSASGCHVGQGGGGPHCHADGYQSGQGLGLYNDADYVGKTHPPLLGFGYDGIALFGNYRSSDSAMLGYSTALDSFGVHNHDLIGSHYHAHTVSNYTSVDQKGVSTTKDMHVLMKGAYIGSTNSVPFFRTSSSFNTNKYLGGQ